VRIIQLEIAIVTYQNEFSNAKAAQIAALSGDSAEPARIESVIVGGMHTTACDRHPYETSPELPDDLAPIDDAFLGRLRQRASLI